MKTILLAILIIGFLALILLGLIVYLISNLIRIIKDNDLDHTIYLDRILNYLDRIEYQIPHQKS